MLQEHSETEDSFELVEPDKTSPDEQGETSETDVAHTVAAEPSKLLTWEQREARAITIGKAHTRRLAGDESASFTVPTVHLRNRYWTIINTGHSNFSGITDRWSCAFKHLCPEAEKTVHEKHKDFAVAKTAIFHGFPSLRESRLYYQQAYPSVSEVPILTLPTQQQK